MAAIGIAAMVGAMFGALLASMASSQIRRRELTALRDLARVQARDLVIQGRILSRVRELADRHSEEAQELSR